jgi:hypothetical protein
MEYIEVRWKHEDPAYPVLLYSELDGGRWETRKVEVFADGTMTFADGSTNSGTTLLGAMEVPRIAEIASQDEFEPRMISAGEFEAVWLRATTAPPPSP